MRPNDRAGVLHQRRDFCGTDILGDRAAGPYRIPAAGRPLRGCVSRDAQNLIGDVIMIVQQDFVPADRAEGQGVPRILHWHDFAITGRMKNITGRIDGNGHVRDE